MTDTLFLIALARALDSPPAVVARLHGGLTRAAMARETAISLAGTARQTIGLAQADRLLRERVISLCKSHGLKEPIFGGYPPGRAIKVKLGQRWHYVPTA